MCRNAITGVSVICAILNTQALFAGNLQSLDSSEQLSGLSSEHWAHNQLNAPSLSKVLQALEVSSVLAQRIRFLAILLAHE